MKKTFYYLLGIVILGWIVASCTMLVLKFLPIFALTLVLTLPIYGVLRMKFKWTSKVFGLGRYLKFLGQSLKFSNKSWTFYLVVGVAFGFIYDEIVPTFLMAGSIILIGGGIFFFTWEGVRIGLSRFTKIKIPRFMEALGQAL